MRTGEFASRALEATRASEGRRRRRKRDTTPDRLGLDLKRALLARLAADDPPPGRIEEWLLEQVFTAEAPGATRAMCRDILDEYGAALASPSYREWLESGAPSDDREAGAVACPMPEAS